MILDAVMRFSGLGMLFLTMTLILRDMRNAHGFWYLLLANICITSHFLGFTPSQLELPYLPRMILRYIDVFQLYFMWLFALSLFQKDFKFNRFHLIVGIVYAFPMLMERCVQFGFLERLPLWWSHLVNGLNIILIIHMIVFTLRGRSDDLIEKRRKSRLYLVFMMALCATIVVICAHILLKNGWTEYQPTVNIIGVWPAIIWSCFWLLSIDQNKLAFDHRLKTNEEHLSHRDLQLQKQLNRVMIEQQSYLEVNLSIESLAQRLGVSAYRLRAFINQTLGHTNFSSYVNTFRIEAIKKAFLSPENEHVPILTIALNHGFNSLSPFNRSFKKIEQITPTQYRQNLKLTD